MLLAVLRGVSPSKRLEKHALFVGFSILSAAATSAYARSPGADQARPPVIEECTSGAAVRRVKLAPLDPFGSPHVSCKIIYFQKNDGFLAPKLVWDSEQPGGRKPGACDIRFNSYVSSLKSHGWSCHDFAPKVAETQSAVEADDLPVTTDIGLDMGLIRDNSNPPPLPQGQLQARAIQESNLQQPAQHPTQHPAQNPTQHPVQHPILQPLSAPAPVRVVQKTASPLVGPPMPPVIVAVTTTAEAPVQAPPAPPPVMAPESDEISYAPFVPETPAEQPVTKVSQPVEAAAVVVTHELVEPEKTSLSRSSHLLPLCCAYVRIFETLGNGLQSESSHARFGIEPRP